MWTARRSPLLAVGLSTLQGSFLLPFHRFYPRFLRNVNGFESAIARENSLSISLPKNNDFLQIQETCLFRITVEQTKLSLQGLSRLLSATSRSLQDSRYSNALHDNTLQSLFISCRSLLQRMSQCCTYFNSFLPWLVPYDKASFLHNSDKGMLSVLSHFYLRNVLSHSRHTSTRRSRGRYYYRN